ncbi:alpha/beta hydrolase [Mycobacterium dioxanotrophicus]|uniref:Alpha/beta hydrolase n=1 Tax=Mycobacterium dioxanotrophicus TaxID=482462 RepID=A0A1Y0C6I5_9MYCO|nr:alpha/beta hydrolase family protein [Mycobacterium dioxanotrophicus]ART70829.1 alpha/beta hydrolase [Mycobacterium dioxanotrophicus]
MNLTQRATITPHIALDEAVLAVMRRRQPRRSSTAAAERTAADMAAAATLFAERGWLAMPATYHRAPPPLLDSEVRSRRTHARPWGHETMTFASGFRPRAIEPGATLWPENDRNDTVSVRVLRREESRAPWVICLHGFGMGASRFDLAVLWASYLHSKLGFNVALPVSPLHGTRRAPSDGELLSLDLTAMLHGITQSVWDVRRLVSWIRGNTDAPVGVYGVSLGGFLATLLAGLEPLDAVAAALPFTDVLGLLQHHGPPSDYREVIGSAAARDTFRVTSPLELPPVIAPERLSLFAARADRLIPIEQSRALAQAWRGGHVQWFNAGHVGFTWSRAARGVLAARMRDALGPGRS